MAPATDDGLPAWAIEEVHLTDYDQAWPELAAAYAAELRHVLGARLLGPVEHVGSTSIPGQLAKPVIDLMAQVAELDQAITETAGPLGALDWRYVPPELDERPWRRFFVRVSPDGAHRLAHLHLMAPAEARWDQQVIFRDALRADPVLRDEYAALKLRLARDYRHDRERYTAEKGDFVARVLRAG